MTEQTTKIVGIILERDGETKIAYPATQEELAEVASDFERQGISMDACNCGDEVCSYGRVWRCAIGPNNRCQWFRSDWGCQS